MQNADFFDSLEEKNKMSPLASKMRPSTLDEIVGQQHIIGKGKLLYRAIVADKLGSVILYGPPGTGKTTLAKVIANTTNCIFRQINATNAGKKDIEAVVSEAKAAIATANRRTILFIDEIHRFNKGQQDYLLPFVEDGTVTLVGATTENPYFEVNTALLSRCRIFALQPLAKDDLIALIDLTTEPEADGIMRITLEVAEECIQKKAIRYDRDGDNHYDAISAFIESMKHTEPDATLYYLARMLVAGEDIKYIARRICVCASEDVGLANSNALVVATNAMLAIERIGMPEAAKILAHAALYVCCCPKSDTVYGIGHAMRDVEKTGNIPIPPFLQDSSYSGAKNLGRGIGLDNVHASKNHYSGKKCMPKELQDRTYFKLSGTGAEKRIEEFLSFLREQS